MKDHEVLNLIQSYGLIETSLQYGEIIRCKTLSNSKSRSGWYVFSYYNGEVCGAFGDYFIGLKKSVEFSKGIKLDKNFKEIMNEKINKQKEEKNILADKAAIEAQVMWDRLNVSGKSDYAKRKGIIPYGAKYGTMGTLVIPLTNINEEIRGLQVIYPEKNMWSKNTSDKRFWPKGISKSGCFFEITGIPELPILICEGFSTGCSIFEATGLTTIIAFDAGNLKAVAIEIRKKYPYRIIIFCADNDIKNDINIGRIKATEAASIINGLVIFPTFTNNYLGINTDFNDMHRLYGIASVKDLIFSEINNNYHNNF